jgi:hypothetical protein
LVKGTLLTTLEGALALRTVEMGKEFVAGTADTLGAADTAAAGVVAALDPQPAVASPKTVSSIAWATLEAISWSRREDPCIPLLF